MLTINFKHENLHLMSVDFSNNDFSYATVDTNWFNYDDDLRLNGCNFSNTGLNITYVAPKIPPIHYTIRKDEEELYELFQNKEISEEEYLSKNRELSEITSLHSKDEFYKIALGEEIKKGHLDGCYINGKKVKEYIEDPGFDDAGFDISDEDLPF